MDVTVLYWGVAPSYTWVHRSKSRKKFELTANSLGAHIETHLKLILRIVSYLTVNSQDDSHCELAVSFM